MHQCQNRTLSLLSLQVPGSCDTDPGITFSIHHCRQPSLEVHQFCGGAEPSEAQETCKCPRLIREEGRGTGCEEGQGPLPSSPASADSGQGRPWNETRSCSSDWEDGEKEQGVATAGHLLPFKGSSGLLWFMPCALRLIKVHSRSFQIRFYKIFIWLHLYYGFGPRLIAIKLTCAVQRTVSVLPCPTDPCGTLSYQSSTPWYCSCHHLGHDAVYLLCLVGFCMAASRNRLHTMIRCLMCLRYLPEDSTTFEQCCDLPLWGSPESWQTWAMTCTKYYPQPNPPTTPSVPVPKTM